MGYIKYENSHKQIVTKKYHNNVTKIDLSSKNIVKILEIEHLTHLQELHLFSNQIASIEGLEHLTQLQKLYLSDNKIISIGGLEHLTQLQILNLSLNQITSIESLEHLTQLHALNLFDNKITSVKKLKNLTQLQTLDLSYNQIISMEGLEYLTQLQILYLFNNQLTSIENLEHLTRLRTLYLSSNQLTSIENLQHLTQLQTLYLCGNKITYMPFSIMNLHNLSDINYDYYVQIDPIIMRFLNRNKLKTTKLAIYNDSQNVHDSNIHQSISQSIYRILGDKLKYDNVLEDILNDQILTNLTKKSLIEYSNMENIHSTLNITFKDLLCSVWYIIKNHKDVNQIKNILNEEMKDSLCKCFTGRICRLTNCLNGFDERISIKISNSSEISNIIILIKNKFSDTDNQKKEIIKELKERKYSDAVINEWIGYL